MKIIKNIIDYLIAISVIPAIVLTVINVTGLKEVKMVQFELLTEENGEFIITNGTFNKLIENKGIINYDIESNYPLLTHEELDRASWKVSEELYNEIIDRETNPRIVEKVGKVVFDGTEDWQYVNPNLFVINDASQYNMVLNTDDPNKITTDIGSFSVYTTTDLMLRTDISFSSTSDLKLYLSQNPLTVYYELAVKNPTKVNLWELDFNGTSQTETSTRFQANVSDYGNEIYIHGLEYLGVTDVYLWEDFKCFRISNNLFCQFPKSEVSYSVTSLKRYLQNNNIIGTFELAQPRLAEQYDFSKFKLTYDNNRIRVLFDIDESYYLWEITNNDRLIPIIGLHEVGNTWTVKYYVYEIQQPLLRSLVLLIPLIVISGLLLYLYNLIKKKDISY